MKRLTKADREREARANAERNRLFDAKRASFLEGRRAGYHDGTRWGALWALRSIIGDAERNGTTPTIPVAILDEARTLIDDELKRLARHDGDFHVQD